MIYADFQYYQNTYFGVMITEEDTYNRYATRASTDIDYFTFGRAKDNADMDSVKLACCAVAEQYAVIEKSQTTAVSESGELQSESVGSYSRTYRSSSEAASNARSQIKTVIEHYLGMTGMLYRGASVCMHRTM